MNRTNYAIARDPTGSISHEQRQVRASLAVADELRRIGDLLEIQARTEANIRDDAYTPSDLEVIEKAGEL